MSPVPPTAVGKLSPPTGLRSVCRYSAFQRMTKLPRGNQLSPNRSERERFEQVAELLNVKM